MSQQMSPWLEGAYGWNFGEGGWNTGMDQNLLKFSFMFDRNIDSIVASLPAAVNGQAHYLTTDNRLYFVVGTTYFSTAVPKWFTVIVRGTGATWQFNGTTLVQIESVTDLDTRLTSVEVIIASLGSAAFNDVSAFATAAELDVVEGQAQSYTDILRSDLSNATDPAKGAGLSGYKGRSVASRLSDVVSVKDFGAKGDGVTDDSAAIQAAHDSFPGNDGGAIFFPRGRYRVDSTINITKAGVRLLGVSQRASMIISRVAGTTINVKVLYNGTSNTDPAYCKFGIDNLAIGASYYGDATVTGVGLMLQNVFADTFTNVYMFGFKKHIVFNGVHMMKFLGIHFQSAVQDHPDLPGFKTVIHNRPLAISGTSEINDAFENGGVGNSFDGGWFENVSFDTTYLGNTVFSNIDFEPASNSAIIGDQNIFENNRFERFGIYAPAQYPYFPWFIVNGNANRFRNNQYNVTGAVLDTTNPVYLVNGAKNDIELPEEFFSTYGLAVLGAASFANTIYANTTFADYQNTSLNPDYKNELTSIKLGGFDNTIVYSDGDRSKTVTALRSAVSSTGEFKNLAIASNNLHDTAYWSVNDATVSRIATSELPAGRGNINHFAKVTLTAATGNRRFFGSPSELLALTAGVYSAGFMLYIPATASVGVLVGASLGANYEVDIRDTWTYVRVRGYFNVGDPLVPTVRMLGGIGDYFLVGEISICEGQVAAYSSQGLLTTNNNSGAPSIPPRSSNSGAGVLAGLYNVPIIFSVQDNATPDNYCIATGIFPITGSPVLSTLSSNIISLGATNPGGTVTIIGSTDYTILVRPL